MQASADEEADGRGVKDSALSPARDTTADYWPIDRWRERLPESEGFSSGAFATMLGEIRKRGPAIHSLLVIRRGNIILDANGVTHGWGDLQLTTRDLAKIGYLLLHDGVWNGTRILPAGWIARTSEPISKYNASDWYGMGWWTHPESPPGMYEGIGTGGQRLTIWPAKDLIVVFTGGGFEPGDIGAMLLGAYKADTAIAADPAGADQLRLGLALAAQAPSPTTAASPPEAARRASGHVFDFPSNDFQLHALTFFFDPGRERVHAVA